MPLNVEVVSPEEELFSGEAEFVLAHTVDGEIGILAGHTPLLGQLGESALKVRTSSGEEKTFEATGGFIVVKEDRVIVLTSAGVEAPASE